MPRCRSAAQAQKPRRSSTLGDEGLAHIADALPSNTHLWLLDVSGNGMSERFAAERLLPAVRANAGLMELRVCESRGCELTPAALEAEELVCSRPTRRG